ncbi:MAG: hypothetical protein IKM27_07155 [Clostridia bacterium]|nr:hypothetical protein [Clostridia bacterium]
MKKTAFLLFALIVSLQFSSCIHLLYQRNEASDDTSVQQSGEEDHSFTDESSLLSEKSPYELCVYAEENNESLVSYTSESVILTDISINGSDRDYETTIKTSASGINTDDPQVVVHFEEDEEGCILTFAGNRGFLEDGVTRISFSCDYGEFSEFAEEYINPTEPGQEGIDPIALLKENMQIERLENGDLLITAKGEITDEESKRQYMGSTYLQFTEMSAMEVNIHVTVNPEGYMTYRSTKISFTAKMLDGNVKYSAESKFSLDNLNEKVKVSLPILRHKYIGDISYLSVFSGYSLLEYLPQYSGTQTRNVKLSGGNVLDEMVLSAEFNWINGDSPRFSMKDTVTVLPDDEYVVRSYFEDGVFYQKFLNDTSEKEVGDHYFNTETLSLWASHNFAVENTNSYTFTDNGDGTAVMTFSYDAKTAHEFMASFASWVLGEDYANTFSTVPFTSFSSSASIIYDLETGTVIKHTYSIYAEFEMSDEIFEYTEEGEITVSTEDVVVPERAVFIGTSEL